MLLRTIAVAVIVAPLAAAAQSEVSRATITGTPVVRTDVLRVCAERNDRLWDRSGLLERDKQDIDREGRDIDRVTAQLDLLNADSSELMAYCNRITVGSR